MTVAERKKAYKGRLTWSPDDFVFSSSDAGEKGGSGSGNFGHQGRIGKVGGSGEGGIAAVDSEGKMVPGAVGQSIGIDTSTWNKGNSWAQWALKKIHTIEKLVKEGQWDVLASKQYSPKPGMNKGSEKYVKAILLAQEVIAKIKYDSLGSLPEPMVAASPKTPEVAAGSKWEKIGDKLGSQEGGTYMFEGKKYYVKLPNDPDRARNEVLATKLYQAAGAETVDMNLVTIDGKLGVASEWIETAGVPWGGKGPNKDAAENFGAHAWLANWDCIGAPSDMNNIRQKESDGKLVIVDAGGTMNYRAQEASGLKPFSSKEVLEWDSLRNAKTAPAAAQVFGSMTPQQLLDSASKLSSMKIEDIEGLVNKYGPGDAVAKANLAETLIARRMIVMQKGAEAVGIEVVKPKVPESWEEFQVQAYKPEPSSPGSDYDKFGNLLPEAKSTGGAAMAYPPKPTLSKTFAKHYQHKIDELWDAAEKGPEAVMAVKTNPNAGSPLPKKVHEYKMQILSAMGHGGHVNPDHVQAPKSSKAEKITIKPDEFPDKPSFVSKNAAQTKANQDLVDQALKHAEKGDIESLKAMTLTPSPKLKTWHSELLSNVSSQLNPPKPPKKIDAAYAKAVEHISGQPAKNALQKLGYWTVLGDVGGIPHGIPDGGQEMPPTITSTGKKSYDKLPDSQRQAIKYYTGSGHGPINDSLRDSSSKKAASTEALSCAIGVMKSMHDLPPGHILWRKHSGMEDHEIAALQPGHVVSDKGVLSTSRNMYTWHGKVWWKLTTGPGAKGLSVEKVSSHTEYEVILPPNQRMLVTKVTKKSGSYDHGWEVEAVVLPTQENQCCPP